jgi:hypothetical protein
MLATAAAAVLATVAASPSPPGDRKGALTLVVENDAFGVSAPDKNYTNGVGFEWVAPQGAEPDWLRRLASLVPRATNDVDARLEFDAGQKMFTPEDLARTNPVPTDRPYAGLLYASAGVIAQSGGRTLDQTQFTLGVVGPSSQAGDAQTFVHRQLRAPRPRGWSAQIPDRVVAAWRVQRTDIFARSITGDARGLRLEFMPTAGVSIGNIRTGANIGVGFRLGSRMPVDFGPPRIAPSLPGSGYFSPRAKAGWYMFGGLDARYTAYDITLDERGANGAKVKREPFGGDIQAGLAGYVGDVRLSYTQVWRTREFREQKDGVSNFGAFSLTIRL